jgi:aminoglycoside phosphotransferase (APT) family kinase protein
VNWLEVLRQARAQGSAQAGYYHDNIRADTAQGPIIVRIPIPGADVMDLRLWDEPAILSVVGRYLDTVPQLLHTCDQPAFQVHSFIHGTLLNDLAPRGTPVPHHVLEDTAQLFAQLAAIPEAALPERPATWPTDSDTIGFAHRLAADSRRVYQANREDHRALYQRLAIPDDPFAPTDSKWASLAGRPLVCVHSDVHRKNIILDGDRSFFLDWELALYGDPLYDLAVHVHKTGYLPHERARLLGLWCTCMPDSHIANFEADLVAYLAHEQIKSTLVDSVRYAQAFAGAPAPYPREILVTKLADMLAVARTHWGVTEPVDKLEIADALGEYTMTSKDAIDEAETRSKPPGD